MSLKGLYELNFRSKESTRYSLTIIVYHVQITQIIMIKFTNH